MAADDDEDNLSEHDFEMADGGSGDGASSHYRGSFEEGGAAADTHAAARGSWRSSISSSHIDLSIEAAPAQHAGETDAHTAPAAAATACDDGDEFDAPPRTARQRADNRPSARSDSADGSSAAAAAAAAAAPAAVDICSPPVFSPDPPRDVKSQQQHQLHQQQLHPGSCFKDGDGSGGTTEPEPLLHNPFAASGATQAKEDEGDVVVNLAEEAAQSTQQQQYETDHAHSGRSGQHDASVASQVGWQADTTRPEEDGDDEELSTQPPAAKKPRRQLTRAQREAAARHSRPPTASSVIGSAVTDFKHKVPLPTAFVAAGPAPRAAVGGGSSGSEDTRAGGVNVHGVDRYSLAHPLSKPRAQGVCGSFFSARANDSNDTKPLNLVPRRKELFIGRRSAFVCACVFCCAGE